MASRFTKLVCTIHDDFWVLLFVEAFSTGMMLTIGSPVRTEAVIVKSKGLDQLTQTLNQQLLTTAAKSGASLDKRTVLVTTDDTQRLAKNMVAASFTTSATCFVDDH